MNDLDKSQGLDPAGAFDQALYIFDLSEKKSEQFLLQRCVACRLALQMV